MTVPLPGVSKAAGGSGVAVMAEDPSNALNSPAKTASKSKRALGTESARSVGR